MKSLEERINAALGRSSRAPDVAGLIDEIDTCLTSLRADEAAARKEAHDPATSMAEALAAKDRAGSIAFAAERLVSARHQLSDRLDELREKDGERARDEQRARLVAENSDLADELAERWPALVAEMASLLKRLKENHATIAAFNRGHPADRRIIAAEYLGRETNGPYWPGGGGLVAPLHDAVRLPGFALDRRAWPPEERLNFEAAAPSDRKVVAA